MDATAIATSHHGRVRLKAVVRTTKQISVGEQIDRVASVVDVRPLLNQIAIEIDEIGPDGVQRGEQVVSGSIAFLSIDEADGLVLITGQSLGAASEEEGCCDNEGGKTPPVGIHL